MTQKIIQHLKKSLLGRLRIKLFSEISENNLIPVKEEVESFILKNRQLSTPIIELYAAILLLSDYSWESFSSLKDLIDVKKLLIALERFPLKNHFFIELKDCPNPLPKSIGILIKCSELAKVNRGFVYSIYILEEGRFPKAIIDYIEVRACECLPNPFVCSHTAKSGSTSDLNEIAQSLTIQIALKSLYYVLHRHFQKQKNIKEKEILKVSKLLPVSDNLFARFLTQKSGRMELALVIRDEASAEELRSAWSKIDILRTRLREKQGTDLNQPRFSFLYNYYQMHKYGWSYNLIAMDLNYDCLVNLCKASDEIIDIDSKNIKSLGFISAYQILKSVRMKEEDILNWLISGLEAIWNKNCPWSPQNGPVDKQRMRDALRQWERDESSQKVIVQQPPKTDLVFLDSVKSPVIEQYNQMAKDLLTQDFPGSYESYHADMVQIINKTGYIGYIHM